MKLEKINGYQLTTPMSNVDAGNCKWGFAEKDGIEFFLKEFLKPKYPMDASLFSPEQYQKMLDICHEFESKKRKFYEVLNRCITGGVVTAAEFFRYKSRYYLTTEKIDVASISLEEVATLSLEKKGIIAKVLVNNVRHLHENKIVHGDLKPKNVLIKPTKEGFYTTKLIDFDSSFFEHEAPTSGEEVTGDMVYFAPEAILLINGKDVKITRKVDVFAIGVMLHQYFAGSLPKFDTKKNNYISGAILNDDEVIFSNKLQKELKVLIRRMLAKKPEDRPCLDEVFEILGRIVFPDTGGGSGGTGGTTGTGGTAGTGVTKTAVLKIRKKCERCGNIYTVIKYNDGTADGGCECPAPPVKKSAFAKAGDL